MKTRTLQIAMILLKMACLNPRCAASTTIPSSRFGDSQIPLFPHARFCVQRRKKKEKFNEMKIFVWRTSKRIHNAYDAVAES